MKLRPIALPLLVVVSITALAFAGSGTWSSAPSLHTARDGHASALLSNGNIVVAGGGGNNNNALASTEVYSSTTGSWTNSGNLNTARSDARALLLSSGQVLIAGGCVSACLGATTASAELYNSVSGTWTKTGSMLTPRTYFAMVMLPSGQVLVVGGCTGLNANGCSAVTAKAEIYNPSTGKWTATGPMISARGSHSATLLPNGQVLVAGGVNGAGNPIAAAELFNPATGKWAATGKLLTARDEHTATLLATGNVLVVGGENLSGVTTSKTELYNPSTGKWTASGNVITSRLEHTATLLMNGNLLISGGNNVTANNTTVLSSAELYNPATGKWSATGNLANARVGHTATLMVNGDVMDVAGSNANNELNSCEIYTP